MERVQYGGHVARSGSPPTPTRRVRSRSRKSRPENGSLAQHRRVVAALDRNNVAGPPAALMRGLRSLLGDGAAGDQSGRGADGSNPDACPGEPIRPALQQHVGCANRRASGGVLPDIVLPSSAGGSGRSLLHRALGQSLRQDRRSSKVFWPRVSASEASESSMTAPQSLCWTADRVFLP
jgi:hypothetical protein